MNQVAVTIRVLFCYAFFQIISISLQAQIVINEFMAANASVIQDPDFDKNSDWIEIFNTSSQEIDLSGYFLTDNMDNSTKWQIPDGTIIAGQSHLLFWADGEDTGLHTNFKLSKDGESIGVFNAMNEIVDMIEFSAQETDISFGRMQDGDDSFIFFTTPTPATANGGSSFSGVVYFKPRFSYKGGFYNTPIEIALESLGGDIRYTLDGTAPNDSSTLYIEPISISSTSVVRARVFESGKVPGKIITHSYFFDEDLNNRKLPVISVVTDPAHFWSLDIGLYMQDFLPEWEYPINIEMFENDGNNQSVFNQEAGVKMNGNNSWLFPQKILGIYFRNDYGKKNVDYPIFANRERAEFDQLALRASGNDQGSTFFRDGLIQAVVKDNMDFDLQGFKPASVYVNGEYLVKQIKLSVP